MGARYACGYVLKRVREDIERRDHHGKASMLSLIFDLTALDEEVHCSHSTEWTHTVETWVV
jgi:hypothetical protein